MLDSVSSFGLASWNAVIRALDKVCQDVENRGFKTVAYKLHPDQVGSPHELKIDAYFRNVFDRCYVVKLDNSTALEDLAFEMKDTVFYVNVSSVAISASYLGREVLSYARLVGQCDRKFEELINGLPGTFRDCVTML